MNRTPNYGLEQPLGNEYLDPGPFNRNMDLIDAKLKEMEDDSDSVKGAPVLDAAPADDDYAAVTDTSDGGKTKRVLWSRIKALFAAASHGHPAGEIAAGDFPDGEFSFGGKASEGRTRIRLRPTGAPEGAQYQGALEYLYPYTSLRALISPTEYVDLKLQGSAMGQTMVSLVKGRDGSEQSYYLYGTHYKPTVSGGYTGDGATERRISLGGIPKVLFVASKSSMGGIAELAIIINFEGLTNLGAGESGITFLNVQGNPTMMNNQIYVASTQLIVGNHLGSNFFFNQSGVSYSYWGVRV